ncbi:endonuclease, putative [Ixodes scapularis]|uniref:Flap endonuclease 1 n=1 Tax=Ixodes scapularis TaxID=6945 RepID=B7Q1M0_IXOSC|nr:endonuclease, putative [Ixodes scapularis]|eukprot:XP_002409855.1 endonuclease, putative [Ixodes scapularis]
MGITGLSKVIADNAPSAIKEGDIKSYFGKKIAIDASMCLYQFLIAVRQENNMLTNSDGETTRYGLPTRAHGLDCTGPVRRGLNVPSVLFIADCKSCNHVRHLCNFVKLNLRCSFSGNQEDINKFSKRLVKVTRQHGEDCKRLLGLMGVPYIEAPCEAEAQCAELVKGGKVYGTATEDMDGLTFGTNVLLRHMTYSEARKMPIKEFNLERVLSGLELNRDEFIDLCILLGCDYCESIRGIGPKRAIELIKQHKSIEKIISSIDTKACCDTKYTIPEDWPFKEARQLFLEPEVTPASEIQLKWTDPDEDGLVKFLCEENGFSEERIRNGAKKLLKGRNTTTQGRLDSFFKVVPSEGPSAKRKSESKDEQNKKKKGASRGGKFRKGK